MGSSQFAPLTNPRTVTVSGAPTVNDDNTIGYAVGNIWHDTTGDLAYRCEDASTGAAVWSQIDTKVDDSTIELSSGILQVKNNGIVTAKIADDQVTPAKLQYPIGTYASASSSTFSTSSTSYVDVTNLSVTLNANGRPILFFIVDFDTNSSNVRVQGLGTYQTADITADLAVVRGASTVLKSISFGDSVHYSTSISRADKFRLMNPVFWVTGETGSNTYKIQGKVGAATPSGTLHLSYKMLVAVVL